MPTALRPLLAALLCGILFGVGLVVAGMHDPHKVLAFLDLAGAWDPSLALVMIGAIGAGLLPFQWLKRCGTDLFGEPLGFPTKTVIDRPLLVGSALFGIGWGLAGICPGPALVDVALLWEPALEFGVGLAGGLLIFALSRRRA